MGVLSNELSSWRKNIVDCPPNDVTTLNFRDTRPNVMLVMNPTDAEILCNLDSIPTANHYDFRIKNHYARLVGKPVATSQVYFLNNDRESVTLQVYSIYDKNFDPSWLADFSIENVNIDGDSIKPIVEAIKSNNKMELTGYSGTDKLPVTDPLILDKMDKLMDVTNSDQYRNLGSLVTRLERICGTNETLPNYNKSLKDLWDVFNADCAILGTSFGSTLLNDEVPAEGLLGIYNIIVELQAIKSTIVTESANICTKLQSLIDK